MFPKPLASRLLQTTILSPLSNLKKQISRDRFLYFRVLVQLNSFRHSYVFLPILLTKSYGGKILYLSFFLSPLHQGIHTKRRGNSNHYILLIGSFTYASCNWATFWKYVHCVAWLCVCVQRKVYLKWDSFTKGSMTVK